MEIKRLLEKISPHIVVGVAGTELTDGERSLMEKMPPAGVIIMARNVSGLSQLGRLTCDVIDLITAVSGSTPLVMADHEGGRTSVLSRAIGTPPSQMAAWMQGDRGIFKTQLRETAARMRSAGINMVLAPVADINSEHLNPIIGTRAYSETVNETSDAVGEAVRVLSQEGLLTSLKHFPGHGSSVGDSHIALPHLGKSLAQLRESDIIPFIRGIEEGADSVMTAHIASAGNQIPASLDPGIIKGILRDEIGFDGVVITDGLEMAGILAGEGLSGGARTIVRKMNEMESGGDYRDIFSPDQPGMLKPSAVARSALEAGNDLLLFSRPAEAVYSELEKLLPVFKEDESFWDEEFVRITADSGKRIIAMRNRASLPGKQGPGRIRNDEIYSRVANRTVKVFRDPEGLLPFDDRIPLLPVFCGEKKDFEYYPVEEFVSTLCRSLGLKPELNREKFLPCFKGPGAGTGDPLELFSNAPVSAESPGEKILVLVNRRPLSSVCLKDLSEGYNVIIAAERPWTAESVPVEKTSIVCMGTSRYTAEAAGELLVKSL
ncbi:MAG: glycoside hydrolase family 3 protein [Candidatus Krumholzibacteriota bacterium]|nr:glycoside hydrolase family 3 protein [Candidatus Krumholzibacteriota bacterium]